MASTIVYEGYTVHAGHYIEYAPSCIEALADVLVNYLFYSSVYLVDHCYCLVAAQCMVQSSRVHCRLPIEQWAGSAGAAGELA